MHYMARRFFQDVSVVLIPSRDGAGLDFTMVNDTFEAVDIELESWQVDLNGQRKPLQSLTGRCSSDRAELLGRIKENDISPDCLIFWRFKASNGQTGEGHHVLDTYKALDLQPSELDLQVSPLGDGSYSVTVRAAGLALHVMVEADCVGSWSDNLFDLTAGESRTTTFMPADASAGEPQFKLFDLHGCYTQS